MKLIPCIHISIPTPLIPLNFFILSLFCFTLNNAKIIFFFNFHSIRAKAAFDLQKGEDCVHKAPLVLECGRNNLSSIPVNKEGYVKCIEALEIPDKFKKEVLTLQPEDFKKENFNTAYVKKLNNYATALDNSFPVDNAFKDGKINIAEFSINWLALSVIPTVFVTVYLINRFGGGQKKLGDLERVEERRNNFSL